VELLQKSGTHRVECERFLLLKLFKLQSKAKREEKQKTFCEFITAKSFSLVVAGSGSLSKAQKKKEPRRNEEEKLLRKRKVRRFLGLKCVSNDGGEVLSILR
jgi:hypothetical protein